MKKTLWQSRYRGTWRWDDETKKPDHWYLQCEYRKLVGDVEVWRSEHMEGYNEKP
jgi:hypothetical protein